VICSFQRGSSKKGVNHYEDDDLPVEKTEITDKSIAQKTGLTDAERKRRIAQLFDAGLMIGDESSEIDESNEEKR
jgi:hypothetical protein